MNDLEIIKSASIILQRTSGEVFLAKRSDTVSFFPGFWVFPGGKIDDVLTDDWEGTEFEVVETIFREMYEEIGIVAGSKNTIPASQRNQSYLVQNYDDDLRRQFKEEMIYVGKKQTPPFRKKIYNAAYYWIQDELVDEINPEVDGGELVDGKWVFPEEAIAHWEEGEFPLPPPILHLLRNLTTDHFVSITLNETYLPIGIQTRIEFAPGYQTIPISSDTIDPFFTTNLIIIGEDEDFLIVDPGSNAEGQDQFKQILLSIPREPDILLTHHHRDHWDGLSYVAELYPDAVVHAHPKTLERVATSLSTKELKDGEMIDLGDKHVRVVYTPGHTDGHIALYDDERDLIVAGDHVVGYGSAVLDPRSGNMIDYFTSTEELIQLDPKIALPAHGPPNFAAMQLLIQYLEHRKDRENAILDAIKEGHHDLDAIVEKVYTDVPQKMWGYAKRNIQLHIDKLDHDNKLPKDFER